MRSGMRENTQTKTLNATITPPRASFSSSIYISHQYTGSKVPYQLEDIH